MKKYKILLGIIVMIALVILIFFSNTTFSSFISKITGQAKTEIAEPIFIIENTDSKVLDDNNTEINYYFNVKNYNDSNRSETNLKYYIEVEPQNIDKSIVFTLYKDNEIVKLNNQKTDYIELDKNKDDTHSYKLNVKYNRENSNTNEDIKEKIFIKTYAIQS